MKFRIKQHREENNVTQSETAELLGITIKEVDKMENDDNVIRSS